MPEIGSKQVSQEPSSPVKSERSEANPEQPVLKTMQNGYSGGGKSWASLAKELHAKPIEEKKVSIKETPANPPVNQEQEKPVIQNRRQNSYQNQRRPRENQRNQAQNGPRQNGMIQNQTNDDSTAEIQKKSETTPESAPSMESKATGIATAPPVLSFAAVAKQGIATKTRAELVVKKPIKPQQIPAQQQKPSKELNGLLNGTSTPYSTDRSVTPRSEVDQEVVKLEKMELPKERKEEKVAKTMEITKSQEPVPAKDMLSNKVEETAVQENETVVTSGGNNHEKEVIVDYNVPVMASPQPPQMEVDCIASQDSDSAQTESAEDGVSKSMKFAVDAPEFVPSPFTPKFERFRLPEKSVSPIPPADSSGFSSGTSSVSNGYHDHPAPQQTLPRKSNNKEWSSSPHVHPKSLVDEGFNRHFAQLAFPAGFQSTETVPFPTGPYYTTPTSPYAASATQVMLSDRILV